MKAKEMRDLAEQAAAMDWRRAGPEIASALWTIASQLQERWGEAVEQLSLQRINFELTDEQRAKLREKLQEIGLEREDLEAEREDLAANRRPRR